MKSFFKFCYQQLQWLSGRTWVEWLVRLGFAAKGAVYFAIGLLCVRSQLGFSGVSTSTQGALILILASPLGRVLLMVLGVGLAGYVLWRLFKAILDLQPPPSWRRGLQRAGYVMSGLSYAGVAYSAATLALEIEADSDDTVEDAVSILLDSNWGLWLVFLAGLGVIAVGVGYLQGAYTGSYLQAFDRERMPGWLRQGAVGIGRVGIAARGLAFAVIGSFLIEATLRLEADAAGSLGSTLEQLRDRPLGPPLLGLVAFGFLAYGVYMGLAALYQRYEFSQHR